MSIVLDVAIGLTFLYVLLALIATTVQELIATFLRLRARNLFDAVAGMLEGQIEGKRIVEAFFDHPLIKNLCRSAPRFEAGKLVNAWELPSYIPARTFALALLDVLRGKETASEAVGAREVLLTAGAAVDNIEGNEDLKRALKLLVASADIRVNDLDVAASQVSERVEAWFNDRMARASGWYKRQARWLALVIAGVISVAANASTFDVAEQLWKNENLRDAIVASAGTYQSAEAAKRRRGKLG